MPIVIFFAVCIGQIQKIIIFLIDFNLDVNDVCFIVDFQLENWYIGWISTKRNPQDVFFFMNED